jgi:hypothetical protein
MGGIDGILHAVSERFTQATTFVKVCRRSASMIRKRDRNAALDIAKAATL